MINSKILRQLTVIITLLYCLLMGQSALADQRQASPDIDARKSTFIIGKVTLNPEKHYKALKPMADYLAGRMQDLGFTGGDALLAKNNEEMIQYLREGRVDLVTETPFSAMIYTQHAPAEAIARKWKKGVPTYYSVLFARRDSDITTPRDLLGKKLAFEDPGSTTAYMLPLTILLKQGYRLVKLDSPQDTVPADMIGFVFSYSEQNTSKWVNGKIIDAGAISNLDWDKPDHIPLPHKREYQIIHRSKPVPRAIEIINSNLSPEIKTRVKSLLLNAHTDPDAKAPLNKYQKTKRFDALDKDTLMVLDEIKDLTRFFVP